METKEHDCETVLIDITDEHEKLRLRINEIVDKYMERSIIQNLLFSNI
jgi:hypothetical protein